MRRDNPAMKLATYRDGSRDGQLVVVARDLGSAHYATGIATRLQQALDDWNFISPQLHELSEMLNAGKACHAFAFEARRCMGPLPRAWRWANASACLDEVERSRGGRELAIPAGLHPAAPIYQGASDGFLGPCDDIRADEALGIDFEPEVAVVTGDLPPGSSAEAALEGVRLLMIANDLSLRELLPAERASGGGPLQGKPGTAFGPVAVTPDELGSAWRGGRVHLAWQCEWNGRSLGRGEAETSFHFGQLLSHLCRTRGLCAGSIVGSGTVSNGDASRGYSCIAEQRAIETIEGGAPVTGFMRHGDTLRIEMKDERGQSVFGAIEQTLRPLAIGA
jgi:fumarylacetoacetate (FAA) hydrolase